MEKLECWLAVSEWPSTLRDEKKSVHVTTGSFSKLWTATPSKRLVLGDEVLIGQTVLEKLDLHADCANRRLIPNPAHPDQPVSKVK